ncbi:polysaccharide biosynthesis/export family protein [Kordiimonas marina]|uniref:polysaccharide biosynthesis/export family protein n=1 Tax=Kordiimonas marina TaxID=2872312 RepID=UPI001FF5E675|nr:polysaccharide biosynthesis/export family protein [Kordiimonas marina]MCJ9429952.1 polysaccharide export protein [Kordiimonas marina]
MLKIRFLITLMMASLIGLASTVQAQQQASSPPVPAEASAAVSARYELGPGDKIRVTVYGEDDLSGEFELDGTGIVAMPLIGPVNIGNKDLDSAEALITQKLADGYLINPRVSIEVLNYRPFYILGEVKKPGSYPYVNGMTVLNAIALASGYTYRANENKITITRRVDGKDQKITVDNTTIVLPGDIIRVPERFF